MPVVKDYKRIPANVPIYLDGILRMVAGRMGVTKVEALSRLVIEKLTEEAERFGVDVLVKGASTDERIEHGDQS